MASEITASMRVIIHAVERERGLVVQAIGNKATSEIEEIARGVFVAEISSTDFQSLKKKGIAVRRLAKIPPKTEKRFEVAATAAFYKVMIPHLRSQYQEEMKALGCEIIETIGFDKEGSCVLLVYLNPDQVEKVYNLSCVHSIKLHKQDYPREEILDIMRREPVDIFGKYAPGKQDLIEAFIRSWSTQVNRPLNSYMDNGWFNIKRITDPVDLIYIDDLAKQPYIRDISGSGQPRLCQ